MPGRRIVIGALPPPRLKGKLQRADVAGSRVSDEPPAQAVVAPGGREPDPDIRRAGEAAAERGQPVARPAHRASKADRRDREAEYAAKRRRYAERRAGGRCVECDAPSPGVARCEPCSRKHRESSGAYRGIPVWDPTWTVIEIATGRELGTFDSEADVALCLAFEKLAREEVEVIADISPMATLTASPW